MNTPEWIEYTGSDEQIAEMRNAGHGFMAKNITKLFQLHKNGCLRGIKQCLHCYQAIRDR